MRPKYLSLLTVITGLLAFLPCASPQVNNTGQKPYLGWSSFSQQTIQGDFLTQANMITQSDALKASGLQDHGFVYINLDSGWQGSFDGNGRPIPNSTTFPDIKAMVDHIHANGQKAGIYWIPTAGCRRQLSHPRYAVHHAANRRDTAGQRQRLRRQPAQSLSR